MMAGRKDTATRKDMAGKKIRLEERYGGKKDTARRKIAGRRFIQRRFKGGFPAKTISNKMRSRARQSASTIVTGRGERG